MKFDFEGVLVIGLFLLPGFIVVYIRHSRSSAARPTQSVFGETLSSFAASLTVSSLELALLVLFMLLFHAVREDVSVVFGNGLRLYAAQHPIRVTSVFFLWGLLTLVFGIVGGRYDPLGYIATRTREDAGLLDEIWHEVFNRMPQNNNFSINHVRVWLKSGMCYRGHLAGFDGLTDGKTPRYFYLVDARRWATYDEYVQGKRGERIEVVLLSVEEVNSVDAWWTKEH